MSATTATRAVRRARRGTGPSRRAGARRCARGRCVTVEVTVSTGPARRQVPRNRWSRVDRGTARGAHGHRWLREVSSVDVASSAGAIGGRPLVLRCSACELSTTPCSGSVNQGWPATRPRRARSCRGQGRRVACRARGLLDGDGVVHAALRGAVGVGGRQRDSMRHRRDARAGGSARRLDAAGALVSEVRDCRQRSGTSRGHELATHRAVYRPYAPLARLCGDTSTKTEGTMAEGLTMQRTAAARR